MSKGELQEWALHDRVEGARRVGSIEWELPDGWQVDPEGVSETAAAPIYLPSCVRTALHRFDRFGAPQQYHVDCRHAESTECCAAHRFH